MLDQLVIDVGRARPGRLSSSSSAPWRQDAFEFESWRSRSSRRGSSGPSHGPRLGQRLSSWSKDRFKAQFVDVALDAGVKRARRNRMRIDATLVLVGALTWPTGFVLGFARLYGLLPQNWGPHGLYFAAGLPGTYLTLLAVRPTSGRLIHRLQPLLVCYFSATCALALGIVALAQLSVDLAAAAAPPARDCTPVGQAGCVAVTAEWAAISVISAACAALSARDVRRHPAYEAPRIALARLWMWLRGGYFAYGVAAAVCVVARAASDSRFTSTIDFIGSVCYAVSVLGFASALTPGARRAAYAWMMKKLAQRHIIDEAEMTAGVIAGLVSCDGGGAQRAMRTARTTFRAIPFSSMVEADLVSSREAPKPAEAPPNRLSLSRRLSSAFDALVGSERRSTSASDGERSSL